MEIAHLFMFIGHKHFEVLLSFSSTSKISVTLSSPKKSLSSLIHTCCVICFFVLSQHWADLSIRLPRIARQQSKWNEPHWCRSVECKQNKTGLGLWEEQAWKQKGVAQRPTTKCFFNSHSWTVSSHKGSVKC